MARYAYWSITNTAAMNIYSGGASEYDPKYLTVNGSQIIGNIRGNPAKFKTGPYSDTATNPSFVRTTEEAETGTYSISWVYSATYKGYFVYQVVFPDGRSVINMSYEMVDEADLDDSNQLSGTTLTSTTGESTEPSAADMANETAGNDSLEASSGYQPDIDSITTFVHYWDSETNGEEFFSVANILGVFGIPYQFMPHVDPRLRYKEGGSIVAGTSSYLTDTQGTGLEYADHIASHMPILFLSPGVPNFMTKFSPDEKKTIADRIVQGIAGIADNLTPDELVKDSGKYYTFEYAVPSYYQHVNPMCRIAAGYMDVTNYTWDNVRMDSVNWMNYTMSKLDGIFQGKTDITDYMAVPFYLESETQISESFSNDTTESSIMSSIDSISDIGREAMFVLGYSQAALLESPLLNMSGDSNELASQLQGTLNNLAPFAANNSFIQKVISNLVSVGTGGRLIFPKIWSNSSFARSYDVTIKLRSPDMDNLSIYLNIIVPFLHLLGFVLPRQLDNNPNGFASPFLVRAIYKGFFNVDMGLITSMSVTKGDQSQWNSEGIPTAIDVNLTITDLYENISMTPTTATNWKYDTMDNTCQMDYIATMCGINIYQPEVGRTLRMWLVNNYINRARDVVDINIWGNIRNSIANAITNVWRGKSL